MRSLVFVLCLWAGSAGANVIYEFRETGTTNVVGVMQFSAPPASATHGWSTTGQSDLLVLLLSDARFGLGSGNQLLAGTVSASADSLDGSTLDSGGVRIDFTFVFSTNPLVLSEDKSLSISFMPFVDQDLISIANRITLADGTVLISDLFVDGNWRVQSVAAPNVLMLFAVGLLLFFGVGYRPGKARPLTLPSTAQNPAPR